MIDLKVLEDREYVILKQLETCSAEIIRLEEMIDDCIIEKANAANTMSDKNLLAYTEFSLDLKISKYKLEITRLSNLTKELLREKLEIFRSKEELLYGSSYDEYIPWNEIYVSVKAK